MNNHLEFDSAGASMIALPSLQKGGSLKSSFGGPAIGGDTLIANVGHGMQQYLAGVMQPAQLIMAQPKPPGGDTILGGFANIAGEGLARMSSKPAPQPGLQPKPFGL